MPYNNDCPICNGTGVHTGNCPGCKGAGTREMYRKWAEMPTEKDALRAELEIMTGLKDSLAAQLSATNDTVEEQQGRIERLEEALKFRGKLLQKIYDAAKIQNAEAIWGDLLADIVCKKLARVQTLEQALKEVISVEVDSDYKSADTRSIANIARAYFTK